MASADDPRRRLSKAILASSLSRALMASVDDDVPCQKTACHLCRRYPSAGLRYEVDDDRQYVTVCTACVRALVLQDIRARAALAAEEQAVRVCELKDSFRRLPRRRTRHKE